MFFISSAYSADSELHRIRADFRTWAEEQDIPNWMFEHVRTEAQWKQIPLSTGTAICLSALEASHTYVGLFHNAYGGTRAAHVAQVALTDLEAFHALRLGKRMLLYVVDSDSRDRARDTESLLTNQDI